MGIVFRQSIKSSIIIFFGALLGAVVIFLSNKFLTEQEFGFQRHFLYQAVVASQVAMLGMNAVIAIYIHRYTNDDPRKPVLITICLAIPVGLTVLLAFVYLFFKAKFLDLYQPFDKEYGAVFFFWLPVYTLLNSVMTVMEYYLNSQMKLALAVFIREVILRVLNISLIIFFILKWIDFYTLMLAGILTYVIPIIIQWMIAKKTQGFRISWDWGLLSKIDKKEILHFAWYHMLMGITVMLMGMLDSLMLGAIDGMSSVGIYNNAVYIMTILQIPYRSMSVASLPDLTKSYEAKDMNKVRDFFQRGSINILIAAVAMCALIILNMKNAAFYLNEGNVSLTLVVIILAGGKLVDMATGLNNEMISISKHYKFNFYISIFLIIMIFFFNRLLIPKIGIYGAAWGTTIALIIFNVAKLIFLWMKLRLQPFSRKSIGVLFAGIVAGIAGYFFPFIIHPVVDTIVRSIVIIAAYLMLLIMLKPSVDLNTYLASLKKNKRIF